MKTSLEIINNLSEKEAVKLDSQLVELGLVDDLKNNVKKFEPLFAKANSDYMRTLEGFKQALKVLEDSEVIALKGQAQVKELGLNDNFFNNALSGIKDQKTRVNSAINKLK
jgi:formylmethanofuran dehydrogenase subunit A